MKSRIFLLSFWLVIIAAGIYGCQHKPEITLEYVIVEKPVEVIKYVDRYQTVTVTPEPEIITVYEPVLLSYPESKEALDKLVTEWICSADYGDIRVNHDFNTHGICEVYALALQQFAANKGYYINFQVTGFHAQNSAVIGNDIWFIEPQTGEIWLWGKLE